MPRRLSASQALTWLVNHTFLMGRYFRRPSLKELCVCLAASTIIGILLGVVFGGLALLYLPPESLFASPSPLLETMGRAILQLVVFAVFFFLFCGLPGVTVIPLTVRMPSRLGKWVRGIVYFVGGSLAMAAGLLLLPHITGVRFLSGRVMLFIIASDGTITAILGAVIFSYQRMELEVRRRVQELREKEREASEMQKLADTARLSALQAQINPHFFFNTLNSITALIPRDPALAAETVERLAHLFRYTLRSFEEVLVLFSEELLFVRDYLSIEQLRYGKRLRVEEQVAPSALKWEVPGLILQPVVENAVKHGISGRPEGGLVRIEASVDHSRLRVAVTDNGPGFNAAHAFTPVGSLGNVRKRLGLLYNDAAFFSASRDDGRGETIVELLIPRAKKGGR